MRWLLVLLGPLTLILIDQSLYDGFYWTALKRMTRAIMISFRI